jgi:putative endonuclease
MASTCRGYIYTGVTSNLKQRVYQHREGTFGGYSAHRHTIRLVWHEQHGTMEYAIRREKQLKSWNRAWKINLIEEKNPGWKDLYDGL